MIRNSDEDWSIISSSSDFDDRSSSVDESGETESMDGDHDRDIDDHPGSSINDSEVTQLIRDIDQTNQGSIGSLKLPHISHSQPSSRQSSFGSNHHVDGGSNFGITSFRSSMGSSGSYGNDGNSVAGTMAANGSATMQAEEKSVGKIINFYENLSANTLNLHKSIKQQSENLYNNNLQNLKLFQTEFNLPIVNSINNFIYNFLKLNSQYLIYFLIIPTGLMVYSIYYYFFMIPKIEEPPKDFWNYSIFQSKKILNNIVYEEETTKSNSWLGISNISKVKKNRLLNYTTKIIHETKKHSSLWYNVLRDDGKSLFYISTIKANQWWHYSIRNGLKFWNISKYNSVRLFDLTKHHGLKLWGISKHHGLKLWEFSKDDGLQLWKISKTKGDQLWQMSKVNGDKLWQVSTMNADKLWQFSKTNGDKLWESSKINGDKLWNMSKVYGSILRETSRINGGKIWEVSKSTSFNIFNQSTIASKKILMKSKPLINSALHNNLEIWNPSVNNTITRFYDSVIAFVNTI